MNYSVSEGYYNRCILCKAQSQSHAVYQQPDEQEAQHASRPSSFAQREFAFRFGLSGPASISTSRSEIPESATAAADAVGILKLT